MQEFRDFGPVPWWSWTGYMEKSEMTRQMELMKNSGVDEFFIFAVYGLMRPKFLSDEWFDYIKFTLDEAERLNMRVWIYDDLNWPSGTASGQLPHDFPEYRIRTLARKKVTVPPGESWAFSIGYAPLRTFLKKDGKWEKIELDDNYFVNDSDKEVELWLFPVEITNAGVPLTSKGASSCFGQRGTCDLLNADAVKAWMGLIHEKYYALFADKFGNTLRGFFYDEPHCLTRYGDVPWTDDLDKKFMERYGYDFLDHIPDLYFHTPETEQFRHDFWSLISEISSESFGKTLGKWCADHGVLSTGHCVYEEIRNQTLRLFYNGDIHGILKHQSVPGMDMLCDNTPYELTTAAKWYGYTPDVAPAFLFTAKQMTSTGRFNGAKRMMAEANGVCDMDAGLNREKMVYDWLSGCGVSLLNENTFTYSIAGFLKRTMSNKHWTQTWFNHYPIYSEYCRTMSRFAAGVLNTRVAVFDPEDTIRACTVITEDTLVAPEFDVASTMVPLLDKLMRDHIDYELLFDDVMMAGTMADGKLQVSNMDIDTIILPHSPVLSKQTAEKLLDFHAKGGTLICAGCRPERLVDGSPLDFSMIELLDVADIPAAIRKVHQLPYELAGEGHEEIFSAMRIVDGKRVLLLSNMGKGEANITVTPSPDGMAIHTPGDPGQWRFSGNQLRLTPEQSVLITYAAADGLPAEAPLSFITPGKTLQKLDGSWEYDTDRPNMAVCRFDIGLAPTAATQADVNNVRLWMPVTRDGAYDLEFSPTESAFFWVRGKFQITDKELLDNLKLVIETDIYDRILLNGKEIDINSSTPCSLWDQCNCQYEIAAAAQVGENTLIMRGRTTEHSSDLLRIFPMNFMEPVVITGDFAVLEKGDDTILQKRPQFIEPHQGIDAQGFPRFTGKLILRRRVAADTARKAVLELDGGFFTAAEVVCNGIGQPARVWKPYRFDLPLKAGENDLEITLYGHLGSLLRRAYGCRKVVPRPLRIGDVVIKELP